MLIQIIRGDNSWSNSAIRYSVLVFAVSLTVKLVFLIFFLDRSELILHFNPDSADYYNLAVNLLDHGVFSRSEAPPFIPDNLRTPTYPFFVASVFLLCGRSLLAIAIAQIIIASVTTVLVYLLGRELKFERAGRIAAVLFALDLSALVYIHSLQTETLFVFLFMLSVLLLTKYFYRPKLICLIGSASTLGIAALCRPIALYFWLIAAILFRLRFRFTTRLLRSYALFVVVFFLFITPWIARNYFTFGVANFSSAQGVNLLLVNAAYLEADRLSISQQKAEAMLESNALQKLPPDANEAEQARIFQKLALEKLLRSPFRYLKVHLVGIFTTLVDSNVRDLWFFTGKSRSLAGAREALFAEGPIAALRVFTRSQNWKLYLAFFISILFQVLIYGAATVGLVVLLKQKNLLVAAILLLPAFYLLGLSLPAGNVNFRYPAMPYIYLTASLGISLLKYSAKHIS